MKFKIFTTEIYISFLFAAVIAFMLATDRTGLIIPIFLAVTVHELGHLCAMWLNGCAPKKINLVPATVQIVRSFSSKSSAEYIILLCGPSANLVLFLAFYINYLCYGNEDILILGLLNLIIALFNLLPVRGLDGGSLLMLFISKYKGRDYADRVLRIITGAIAFIILLFALTLIFIGKINISLFIIAVYLFICSIIKN